jgi:hypothetical protein
VSRWKRSGVPRLLFTQLSSSGVLARSHLSNSHFRWQHDCKVQFTRFGVLGALAPPPWPPRRFKLNYERATRATRATKMHRPEHDVFVIDWARHCRNCRHSELLDHQGLSPTMSTQIVWWSQLVISPLWAQELSFERPLEIASRHTQTIRKLPTKNVSLNSTSSLPCPPNCTASL